jgi:hypothetical protein
MRFASPIFATILLAIVPACGDDDGMTGGADARPDGTTPTPDARGPDATPPCEVDFDSDDGGEVRVEYVTFTNPALAPGMRMNSARVFAFMMSNMEPGFFERPTPDACTDLSADDRWPLAQGPTREYVDPGQLIIGGGIAPVNIPHNTAMADTLGRTHNMQDFFYFGVNDAATYFDPGGVHDVIFTGSDTWPAQIYDDQVYIPEDFTNTGPSDTLIQFEADTPVTFTYTPGDNSNAPPGYEVSGVIGVVAPPMGPVMVCIDTDNSGSITIPAESVNRIRALGTSGNVLKQNIAHVVRPLSDGTVCRRLDLLGVRCYTTPWQAI